MVGFDEPHRRFSSAPCYRIPNLLMCGEYGIKHMVLNSSTVDSVAARADLDGTVLGWLAFDSGL
ncbi:MAG: hypothetical protein ACI89D_002449 [Bermanella sp.]